MINDPNHAVRMHMAKVATSLHRVAGSNELLPREQQLETFQEVEEMLKKAHLISVSPNHPLFIPSQKICPHNKHCPPPPRAIAQTPILLTYCTLVLAHMDDG